MTDETKIRVRLDTSQAKSQMDQLERRGSKTAGKLSERVRGAVLGGLGAVGAGAIVGTVTGGAASALRGSTSSGLGDLVGETFGGFGAQLNELVFGKLDDESRAAKAAREETIAAFGTVSGIRGEVASGASSYFEQIKSLRLNEERGRSLIEQDPRFGGTEINNIVDRFATAIADAVKSAIFGDFMGPPSPK